MIEETRAPVKKMKKKRATSFGLNLKISMSLTQRQVSRVETNKVAKPK